MNTQAQRLHIKAEALELQALLKSAKTKAELDNLQNRIDRLNTERKNLDAEEQRVKALRFGMDDDYVRTEKALGRDVYPMAISEDSLKALHNAGTRGQNISVKAFSTVDSLLPATLQQQLVGRVHENRLLDHLPVATMTAPSTTYLIHSSNTNAPTPVAEGALKPDVTLNVTSATATAVKLAATWGISKEALSDYPSFVGYAEQEMTRQLTDLENSQLIAGSGAGNITGFQATSGILTLAYTTGTYLDAFALAIQTMRVGTALATPSVIVVHPGTFGAIRRQKDTQGHYLMESTPTQQTANSIWGVPVVQTTAIAAGTALLIDAMKMGTVFIREGITVNTGTTNDDFSRNIVRYVIEERLTLACERPAAVLNITGLPTA